MNKKWIGVALKLLVSGGLIWLLVGSIDLEAAVDRILAAKPWLIVAAIAAFGLQILIAVGRWWIVMQAMDSSLPFLKTLGISYIGLFFNQALPSSVGGDAVRVYKTYKTGMPLSRAINGVMLDRVATVLGLVLIVVVAVPFFTERVGDADARWVVPAAVLLALAGFAGLVVLMFLDNLPSRFSHYRLVHGLALLAADTRRVFLSPGDALKVMTISLVGHANVAFIVYLIARSLDLGVTWLDCLVLMPPVLLLMTLPISIAGWGVREGAMVTAFGLIGVPGEGALLLSIMFGLLAILTSLPGGLVWLMSGDRKIEDVETTDKES